MATMTIILTVSCTATTAVPEFGPLHVEKWVLHHIQVLVVADDKFCFEGETKSNSATSHVAKRRKQSSSGHISSEALALIHFQASQLINSELLWTR